MFTILVYPRASGSIKCAVCSGNLSVTRNEMYLTQEGQPVCENHGSKRERELLKHERESRQAEVDDQKRRRGRRRCGRHRPPCNSARPEEFRGDHG